MGCHTGADAAFFDSVPFALLRARREQEPSKLTQQLQAARVRTLNRSVPHDLVAHSCLATCSGMPHYCFVCSQLCPTSRIIVPWFASDVTPPHWQPPLCLTHRSAAVVVLLIALSTGLKIREAARIRFRSLVI